MLHRESPLSISVSRNAARVHYEHQPGDHLTMIRGSAIDVPILLHRDGTGEIPPVNVL